MPKKSKHRDSNPSPRGEAKQRAQLVTKKSKSKKSKKESHSCSPSQNELTHARFNIENPSTGDLQAFQRNPLSAQLRFADATGLGLIPSPDNGQQVQALDYSLVSKGIATFLQQMDSQQHKQPCASCGVLSFASPSLVKLCDLQPLKLSPEALKTHLNSKHAASRTVYVTDSKTSAYYLHRACLQQGSSGEPPLAPLCSACYSDIKKQKMPKYNVGNKKDFGSLVGLPELTLMEKVLDSSIFSPRILCSAFGFVYVFLVCGGLCCRFSRVAY